MLLEYLFNAKSAKCRGSGVAVEVKLVPAMYASLKLYIINIFLTEINKILFQILLFIIIIIKLLMEEYFQPLRGGLSVLPIIIKE